ncbi:MAG: PAS domain S-box protein [Elusimicrobia bacterium]|nr:PAS domain S-box protein [Elusimicrobiota bacterium]
MRKNKSNQKLKDKLLKSEEKQRLIFKTSPEAICITDLKGKFIEVNNCAAWMYKFPNAKKFIASKKTFFDFIVPEERKLARNDIKKCINTGYLKYAQYHAVRKDGEVFPMELSASVLNDSSGKPLNLVIVSRDIVWRTQLCHDVEKRVKELRCLYNLSKLIEITDISMEEIFKRTVNMIPPAWEYPKITCAQIIYGDKKFQTGNYKKTKWKQSSSIIVDRKKVGVVNVFCLKERPKFTNGNYFTKEEKSLLNAITEQLGIIINRKIAKDSIYESENKHRALFRSSMDGIVFTDMQGKVLDANHAYVNMLGYKMEEIKKLYYRQLTPERWHKLNDNILKNQFLKRGYSNEFEKECITKNGTVFPVSVRGWLVRDRKGRPVGIWRIIRDITDRKKAQDELHQSEKKYRTLFESSHNPITIVDRNGIVLMINTVGARNMGLTPAKCVGRSIFEVIPGLDDSYCAIYRQVVDTGINIEKETFVKLPSGPQWFWSTHNPVYDVNNNIYGVQIISYDITERKKVEEALKVSEKRYRDITLSMNDLVWEMDKRGRYIYCSVQVENILGYSWEELLGKKPFDLMPPEEAARLSKIFKEISANKQPIKDLEKWNIHKDGRRVCLLTNGVPVLDRNGGLIGYRGVDKDITARKYAEERLVNINKCFVNFGTDPLDNINRLTALCGETLDASCAFYNRFDGEMLCSWGQWNTPSDYKPIDKPGGRICYDVIRQGKDQCLVVRNLLETNYAKTDPNVIAYGLQTYVGWPVKSGDVYVGALCVVYQRDFVPSEADRKFMGIVASAISVEEDRRQAGIAVKKSEERFRQLVEHLGDSLILHDLNGKIIQVNKQVCQSLGYSRDELLKLSVGNIEVGWQRRKLSELWKNLVKTGPITVTGTHCRKDGSTYPVEVRVVPLEWEGQKQILALCRDITERRVAEEALRGSEERYKILFDSTLDGMFVLDAETMKIVLINRALEKMYKFDSMNDAIGKSPLDFIHPEDRDRAGKTIIKDMFENDLRQVNEFRTIRKDGKEIIISAVGTRTEYQGKLAGLVSIHDVTERKKSEEQIRRSLHEKEVLLQEIQHRVKNNLQVIISLMNIQLKKIDDPKVISMFKESMSRISAIALIHTYLYKGGDISHVNMKEFIEELVRSLIMQYSLGKMKLSYSVDVDKLWFPINLSMPCGLIINELIANSLKYAFVKREKGKINVSISGSKNKEITLIVSDDGVGMPDGLDVSNSKSIGYRLIKTLSQNQLHGSFDVKSDKNGTTVTIRFNKGD